MLECKDKEQAVFYLYRLYGLRDVNPRMLRPAAEIETLHTKGRKSNKRGKMKTEQEAATASAAAGENGDDMNGTAISKEEQEEEEEKECEKMISEVEREAEEHGIPPDVANKAVFSALNSGELDCGSGDEEAAIESPIKRHRARKEKVELQSADGQHVDRVSNVPNGNAEATVLSKSRKGRRNIRVQA